MTEDDKKMISAYNDTIEDFEIELNSNSIFDFRSNRECIKQIKHFEKIRDEFIESTKVNKKYFGN